MKHKFSLSKAFTDGIFLLLPFGITIGLIYWIWSILRTFIPDLSIIFPKDFFINSYISQILDILYLLIILLIILIAGMLASTVLGKFLSLLIDQLLTAPTFIKPIYLSLKKLTASIFSHDNNNTLKQGISESIMIPYPNKETKSIAFITSLHAKHLFGEEEGAKWITVYVPSAPIVSAGFYLICKKEDTSPCKLPNTEAMTTIISVGALNTTKKLTSSFTDIKPEKPNILKIWFLNGILFLTPLTATVAILTWAFNHIYTFTKQISTIIPNYLPNLSPTYYDLIINGIIIMILILLIIIIGLLGESAFGIWVKTLSHKIFNSIPMVNKIYSVVEQITKVFSPDPSKNNTFDKAALVPYPTKSTYAIGFLTGKDSSYIQDQDGELLIPVFIPTTPIPTTGWFMTVPKQDIIILDMPIEKAFGLVISGGILVEDQ